MVILRMSAQLSNNRSLHMQLGDKLTIHSENLTISDDIDYIIRYYPDELLYDTPVYIIREGMNDD